MENDFYLTIEQIMKKHNIKDSRHLESRLCFLEKDIEARKKEYKELSNSLLKILIKLNEYESIEDKLGIDLITLFKALENGIFTYDKDKKTIVHKQVIIHSFQELKCRGQDWFISIKKYGKTWALTKEELL